MQIRKEKLWKIILWSVAVVIALIFGRGYGDKVVVPEIKSEVPPPGMYRVMKVVDGDTIQVSVTGKTDDLETVRFIGIDTPETVDPRKPVQCFGKEASNKTKELLTDQNVFLEKDETQDDRDKYGRILRYVFLEDRTNVNQYLIQEGYAHEYTYRIPYIYQSNFKQAEVYAKEHEKGLWGAECE
jgi:micrococcal nuclease